MNITLRQLRAFIAGTKSASFSEAAEKSFLTQPGYSLLIRQLEEELGVKLFDRTTRRVEVTKNGAELAQRLERILQELDDTLTDAHHSAARKRGRVTLGIVPSVASCLLGDIVALMSETAPDISLTVKEELSGPLAEMVATGAVDLAIGVDLGAVDSVSFTSLTSDRMLGVFHPDDPVLANETIRWAALAKTPYVAFAQTSVEKCVSAAFSKSKAEIKPLFEVKFVATAVGIVRRGNAFTVLPELALNLVDLEGLVVKPIHPVVSRNVGILVHSQRSLTPATHTAIKAVTEAFKQITPPPVR